MSNVSAIVALADLALTLTERIADLAAERRREGEITVEEQAELAAKENALRARVGAGPR